MSNRFAGNSRRIGISIGLSLLVMVAITVISLQVQQRATVAVVSPLRQRGTGADWPGYLMNAQNTSYNANEHILSTSSIAKLSLIGMINVGKTAQYHDAVATSVVSIGDTLYFGAWNGDEYALDATTYAIKWRVFLGITTPPAAQQCYPLYAGVSSDATVVNGVLYVGGGDGAVYALNTNNGAIIWKQAIATPPNEYLWGSPVIGNGAVYIGVSSYGDCPLIRARMVMLNQKSGAVMSTYYTATPNEVGDSIWSKPALSPTSGAVVFGTGNGNAIANATVLASENNSIVDLKGANLGSYPASVWHPPVQEVNGDFDFGGSCMIIPNVGGGEGAICHSKNAVVYAMRMTPYGLVPSWSLKLSLGGEGPEHGEGDITSGVFDGSVPYVSTTHLNISTHFYLSAVYALNPITGHVLWRTPFDTWYPLTALAGASDFLVMGLASKKRNSDFAGSFAILNMKTGAVIYQQDVSGAVFGSPSIANGEIYIPTMDGHIYVYGLPQGATAGQRFTSATLPTGWSWLRQDPTTESATPSGILMRDAGQPNAQNLNFLTSNSPAGDYTATATLLFHPTSSGESGSLVAYQDATDFLTLSVTQFNASSQSVMLSSTTAGITTSVGFSVMTIAPNQPVMLELIRVGFTFYGYSSLDGAHWTYVGYVMPRFSTTLVGLTTSHEGTLPYGDTRFIGCVITGI